MYLSGSRHKFQANKDLRSGYLSDKRQPKKSKPKGFFFINRSEMHDLKRAIIIYE